MEEGTRKKKEDKKDIWLKSDHCMERLEEGKRNSTTKSILKTDNEHISNL